MRIAIVTPPIIGHEHRGTGLYVQYLYKELSKDTNIEIEKISLNANKKNFDIVHYPYFDPFFLTLPLTKIIPTVVTVHDLIPLKYPNNFPKGIRGTMKWWIQRYSLQSTPAIITDSDASKEDICRYAGISEDNIYVIYLGVGKQFKNLKKRRENFILHVGDVNFNKNIPRLLGAFHTVLSTFPNVKLMLVGIGFVTDTRQLQNLKKLIATLGITQKVEMVGSVDEKRLIDLYNTALLYIQPSLAEGFGLPVLEAMACGCPVVASNCISLSEITNGAAVEVDPLDEQSIASGILSIINDEKQRKKLSLLGLRHVDNFTWEKTAAKTIDVYKKVLLT